MTMSLTPDDQRERAHAMPAGPAPTTRTVVLDGKDWDIVGRVLTGSGGRKFGCLNISADGPGKRWF
jgi:hypothetical protein